MINEALTCFRLLPEDLLMLCKIDNIVLYLIKTIVFKYCLVVVMLIGNVLETISQLRLRHRIHNYGSGS